MAVFSLTQKQTVHQQKHTISSSFWNNYHWWLCNISAARGRLKPDCFISKSIFGHNDCTAFYYQTLQFVIILTDIVWLALYFYMWGINIRFPPWSVIYKCHLCNSVKSQQHHTCFFSEWGSSLQFPSRYDRGMRKETMSLPQMKAIRRMKIGRFTGSLRAFLCMKVTKKKRTDW